MKTPAMPAKPLPRRTQRPVIETPSRLSDILLMRLHTLGAWSHHASSIWAAPLHPPLPIQRRPANLSPENLAAFFQNRAGTKIKGSHQSNHMSFVTCAKIEYFVHNEAHITRGAFIVGMLLFSKDQQTIPADTKFIQSFEHTARAPQGQSYWPSALH